MDIVLVRKIKPAAVQETVETEPHAPQTSWANKIAISILLASLLPIIVPHEAYAMHGQMADIAADETVFEAGDHFDFIQELADDASFEYRHQSAVQKLRRQLRMNDALKQYLTEKRSPLADYSSTLLQQDNWKKIIALSNAESTMCRRYITATANCWGVGGSELWDMGEDLGEGVEAMNDFLNSSPSRPGLKYSQMGFDQMNGLYKQPARDHWVYNNLEVYNELTALERSIN